MTFEIRTKGHKWINTNKSRLCLKICSCVHLQSMLLHKHIARWNFYGSFWGLVLAHGSISCTSSTLVWVEGGVVGSGQTCRKTCPPKNKEPHDFMSAEVLRSQAWSKVYMCRQFQIRPERNPYRPIGSGLQQRTVGCLFVSKIPPQMLLGRITPGIISSKLQIWTRFVASRKRYLESTSHSLLH